jgi:hypothetical protein
MMLRFCATRGIRKSRAIKVFEFVVLVCNMFSSCSLRKIDRHFRGIKFP